MHKFAGFGPVGNKKWDDYKQLFHVFMGKKNLKKYIVSALKIA